MTGNTYHGGTDRSIDPDEFSDPEALRESGAVPVDEEVRTHDDREYCAHGTDGNAIVGVENDDGELLVLVNPDLSVALLPHATVEDGDWVRAAHRGVEGQTGIEIELEEVEALRTADHVLKGAEMAHGRTHQVVFRASPIGGEIRERKRRADAGSDDWRAEWIDALPEGVGAPKGGAGADLGLFIG